jgi:hypothetical protein
MAIGSVLRVLCHNWGFGPNGKPFESKSITAVNLKFFHICVSEDGKPNVPRIYEYLAEYLK